MAGADMASADSNAWWLSGAYASVRGAAGQACGVVAACVQRVMHTHLGQGCSATVAVMPVSLPPLLVSYRGSATTAVAFRMLCGDVLLVALLAAAEAQIVAGQ